MVWMCGGVRALQVLLLCVKWLIVECGDRMTRLPDLWMNLFSGVDLSVYGIKVRAKSLSGECCVSGKKNRQSN